MYKIYSRPRIKLPETIFRDCQNNKKIKKTLIVIFIIAIAFGVVKHTIDAVSPIYDTLCTAKAKSIATMVANEQTLEVMKLYDYDDLFTIEKDVDNNITMIKSNSNNMSKIASEIALKVQDEIDNRGREDISIAMRKLFRN